MVMDNNDIVQARARPKIGKIGIGIGISVCSRKSVLVWFLYLKIGIGIGKVKSSNNLSELVSV